MAPPLTAEDLLPLLLKLPHGEQVRLAKFALHAAAGTDSPAAYQMAPVIAGEFDSDEDPLSWEPEGWAELDASR